MLVAPYLYFSGSCSDALAFYEEIGLGTTTERRSYAGTPLVARYGSSWESRVLHARFEGEGIRFFASDGPDAEPMKGCALLIETDKEARGAELFAHLSLGGRVTVPFGPQFWGDCYGNCTDRFGVQWAVSAARSG